MFSTFFVKFVSFCGRIATLDMATAVQNLREPDPELQVLGAAYIQHECYNDSDAKVEVQINLAVRIPPKTFVLSYCCSFWTSPYT